MMAALYPDWLPDFVAGLMAIAASTHLTDVLMRDFTGSRPPTAPR